MTPDSTVSPASRGRAMTPDLFEELGHIAIGSRMKRLTDWMYQGVSEAYRDASFPFEPKWLTLFLALAKRGPQSVVELADAINVSHPAINALAGDLIKKGFLESARDPEDKRKRMLTLTAEGKALYQQLEPFWTAVSQVVEKILVSADATDLLTVLSRVESVMREEPFYKRIMTEWKSHQAEQVRIVTFQAKYRPAFEALNREWIEADYVMEPMDIAHLERPESEILEPGGEIFFALFKGEVVGTCAMIKLEEPGCYELAKMAVSPSAQGLSLGRSLLTESLNWCRRQGAQKVRLETVSKLYKALNLYYSVGFKALPIGPDYPYERGDLLMELDLV